MIGVARVKAREPKQEWRRCEFRRTEGVHRCALLLQVRDVVTGAIKDGRQSWPYQTPGIRITTLEDKANFRIRLHPRLEGDYWVSAKGGRVEVNVAGEPPVTVGPKTRLQFDGGDARRKVLLRGTVKKNKPIELSFVREDALDPERNYPVPPARPPPELTRPR